MAVIGCFVPVDQDQPAALVIRYLAEGITNIINIFQPNILSIGGGVCNEKEYLTKPLIEIINCDQYTRTSKNKTQVVTATLGNDAGIIGAASLGK